MKPAALPVDLQLSRPTGGQLMALMIMIMLVCSAVAVAYSVHKSRGLMSSLQRAHAERDRLETEWGQLLLEQHAWGAYGRIGKIAAEQLQMRHPPAAEIIMVRK